jgi:cobalamin-dependent methionine synthase I
VNEGTVHRKLLFDPLTELMAHYADTKAEKKEQTPLAATVEERLKARIIDGNRAGLQADLDEALRSTSALDIINTILLDGMKTVGELFGSGQMQLPFVLQSAGKRPSPTSSNSWTKRTRLPGGQWSWRQSKAMSTTSGRILSISS